MAIRLWSEPTGSTFEPASRAEVVAIVSQAVAEGADGVILGCTEFALLVGPDDLPVPVFDTTEIHVLAGLDFALAR